MSDVRATATSKTVVYAALAGNVLVALTKFGAAALSGSSAMLSEGIHSLVDCGNELLLLHGLRQAARPATEDHPLGFGRELYFWSFVVAISIFGLGAGFAVYEGVGQIMRPRPITHVAINLGVLVLSLVFEGGSWWVAFKAFQRSKGDLSFFQAVRRSKDPTTFVVLFEDSAALAGLALALVGTVLASALKAPVLDGVASLGIGLILALTAVLLARESKGLLIGERADPDFVASVLKIASEGSDGTHANGVMTVHLAPDQIFVALSLEFADLPGDNYDCRSVDN